MEKRWNVYHRGEFFGQKTAREIREALRQGTLDPFDKVSVEGSNIREELIEVDEIFKEQVEPAVQAVANDPGFLTAPIRSPEVPEPLPTGVATPQVFPEPIPKTSEPQRIGAKTEATSTPFERTPEDIHRQEPQAKQTAAKRYYIIDRHKTLGPLSALEIQSLFNRGLLHRGVRVQKIGGQRTLAIHQFIANYAGDRLKELTHDGKIPQKINAGSPSSRVMNELTRMVNSKRRASDRRNRAYVLLVGLGLFLGFLMFLLSSGSFRLSSEGRSRGDSQTSMRPEDRPTKAKSQRPKLVQKATETTPPDEAPAPVPNPPQRAITPVPAPPQPPPVRAASGPTMSASKAKAAASKKTRVQEPRVKSRPQAPVPAPARTTPPAPAIKVAPAPAVPAQGPIARAIPIAGRIQTIGPLSFAPAALDGCANKCKLALRDATGASLKAVFFKSAYYEQLRSRAKSVTLTGNTRMEGGELVLIIQDVR